MKKIVAIAILVALLSGSIFGARLYYMDGIFATIDALADNDVKVGTSVSPNVWLNKMATKYTSPNQLIVADSYGGLRALAYAEYVANKLVYVNKTSTEIQTLKNRVDAIVTISSPITGNQMLQYGSDHLYQRIQNRLNTTTSAYNAMIAPLVPILIPSIYVASIIDGKDYSYLLNGKRLLRTFLPSSPDPTSPVGFVANALDDPTFGINRDSLNTMVPGGSFVAEYIRPTTRQVMTQAGYYYKVKTMSIWYPTITGWRGFFPIITQVEKSFYKTVYVEPKFGEEIATSRFNPNLRVGHVITENNNILQMAEQAGVENVNEKDILDVTKKVSGITSTASSIYRGLGITAGLIPFWGGSLSRPFHRAADVLNDTGSFLWDIKKSVNKEFYLTSNHDGLVTTAHMTLPESGNLNKWINDSFIASTFRAPQDNHLSIISDNPRSNDPRAHLFGGSRGKELWGVGGGFNQPIIQGSVMEQWLKNGTRTIDEPIEMQTSVGKTF